MVFHHLLPSITKAHVSAAKNAISRLELDSSPWSVSSSKSSSFTYSPTILNFDNSTHVHHHHNQSTNHTDKKKEQDNTGWAIAASVAGIVFAFLLGRAINEYSIAKEVRAFLKQNFSNCKLTTYQCQAIEVLHSNTESIESNRLWSVINRVAITAGSILAVVSFFVGAPMAIGGFIILAGTISGAIRLGLNGFETRMAKNIETAISRLDDSFNKPQEGPYIYVPGNYPHSPPQYLPTE